MRYERKITGGDVVDDPLSLGIELGGIGLRVELRVGQHDDGEW